MKPGGVFDPEGLKNSINEYEKLSAEENFWNDRENAEKILSKLNIIRNRLDPWEKLKTETEDLKELYALAVEEEDPSVEKEIDDGIKAIAKEFERLEFLELLGAKFDTNNAFLTIHSGAGGTEACDWVNMLYRMYSRWIERRNFKIQILDMLEAEGGIKSVTIQVNGDYAHGYLKGESGGPQAGKDLPV